MCVGGNQPLETGVTEERKKRQREGRLPGLPLMRGCSCSNVAGDAVMTA